MSRSHYSKEDKSNLGCLAIIGAAVLFLIIFLIIKGFSWDNVLSAFAIISVSFWGLIGLAIGLAAIPFIILLYYAISNELDFHSDTESKWITPFINATFYLVLYGLFRLVFGNVIFDIVDYLDFAEDPESASRFISFIVFDLFVLIGCFVVRKEPEIRLRDIL